MSVKENLDALQLAGMTLYEARAYSVLVGLGEAQAERVAQGAGIPPTKVYAVLDELVRKGWARAEDGRPRRYQAQSPRALLDERRKAINAQLDEAAKTLEARFHHRGTVFTGPFWLLRGAQAVNERYRQLVPDARDFILMALPVVVPEVDRVLAPLLAQAVERGVRVRLLVPSKEHPAFALYAKTGAEMRAGIIPMRVMVIDGRHGIPSFVIPSATGGLDLRALWIPVPELAAEILPAIRWLFDEAAPLVAGAEDTAARGAPTRPRSPRPLRRQRGPS